MTSSFTGNKNANGVDFTSLLLSIESVPDSVGNPNTDSDVRNSNWGFLIQGADSKKNRIDRLRFGYAYFSGQNAATAPLFLSSNVRRRLIVLQGVAGGRNAAGAEIPQWQILYSSNQPNTADMLNAINSVHPSPPALSYSAWSTVNNIPAGMSGAFQDADGDGSENIKEFFFFTNPTDAAANDRPAFASASPIANTITFRRAKNITGVIMKLTSSTDLMDWSTQIVLSASNTTVTDMGDYDNVAVTLPLSGTSKFYRIELSESAP